MMGTYNGRNGNDDGDGKCLHYVCVLKYSIVCIFFIAFVSYSQPIMFGQFQ